MNEQKSEEISNDRGNRWQKITIDQFGYLLNLVLTLAVAVLGYGFSLLRDKDFNPHTCGRLCWIVSILFLLVSIICGLICAVNRLDDFRGTTKRARGQKNAPSSLTLRRKGRRSWILLRLQLGTFAIGTLGIGITITLTYWVKIVLVWK